VSTKTLIGVALTSDGARFRSSHAISADELRDAHPAVIRVNLAHDKSRPFGRVISLFRQRESGDVWAVAVADAPEWLMSGPLYYSSETTMRPDGSDVEIVGLAVCTQPLTVSLRSKGPLTVFDGDLGDAGTWLTADGKRPAGFVGDLLRHAREEWRRRDSRSAVRVGGHNLDDYPWSEGEGMPLRLRDGRPAGKLRRSGGRGRILRVS
jgi:hypothetical protein